MKKIINYHPTDQPKRDTILKMLEIKPIWKAGEMEVYLQNGNDTANAR